MALKQERLNIDGYEEVLYGEDSEVGLRGIIAIHSTRLGPSCGGIRLLPYSSKEEALTDVLRLSKGMSYKSALAGIKFGGGKSVIILHPSKKRPEIFHVFGQWIDSLKGKYIAAKDMNIQGEDLLEVRKKTKHVLGIEGLEGSGGDPSPVTARGVMAALRAAVAEFPSMKENLQGLSVAIQGLGHVGLSMAESLHQHGAKLWVSDLNEEILAQAKDRLNATIVSGSQIFEVPCDIFAPCAVGGVLNRRIIPKLKCKAIVGCANNQLDTEEDGWALHERGVLYAPDYAVNSGGIINVYSEFEGYNRSKALKMADDIFFTMKEIFKRSRAQNKPPFLIADELAEERLYGR